LTPQQRAALSRVAAGRESAELALTGAAVLNVFTGAVTHLVVGIAQGRIAWVRAEGGPARERLDLDGATLVPGLIDPHCHVDLMYTPSAFAQEAVAHGTTLVVADLATLSTYLDDPALASTLDALASAPLKFLWGARCDAPDRAAVARLRWLLARPDVAGSGELTAWPQLLAGEEGALNYVCTVIDARLRVDGHLPGASAATLARAAAGGVSSDHEAISGEELYDRIATGLWAIVRHSSLRPDGAALGAAIARAGMPTGRVMLTADGLLAPDLVLGHVDRVVRAVTAGGVAPAEAVRMATLNPATYLGLDAHVGSLAPGRCADVLAVDDLDNFMPVGVLCDGRPVQDGALAGAPLDWDALRLPISAGKVTAEAIVDVCSAAPPVRIDGVIARLANDRSAGGAAATLIALVTRDGQWITGTTTDDLAIRALATTYTGSCDVLLLGRDPVAMAAAYRRVVQLGGGLATPGAEVALPTFGHIRPGSVPELARELEAFERTAGLPSEGPPFTYLSLFLTLPALPGVALTADGLTDVRSGERLSAARSLRH
jgi:adenine deaminase